MTIKQKVSLYKTEGSADKQYHAQLVHVGAEGEDLYVVNYQFGPRTGSVRAGTKTEVPVSLAMAQKEYTKLVNSKLKDGYTEDVSGQTFAGTENAGRKTEYLPQLLNPIEEIDAKALIGNDDWMMQQKADGERQMLIWENKQLIMTNRQGLTISVSEKLNSTSQAFEKVNIQTLVLDGERIGDMLVVFDILKINEKDLTSMGAKKRMMEVKKCLEQLAHEALVPVISAFSTPEKEALLKRSKENCWEGVVFKKIDGTYKAGRPNSGGDALKYKLWESATVRVKGANATKRSVQMELKNSEGVWVDVGSVSIPENKAMPSAGSLIEVKYLYAFKEGSLFQSSYLNQRTDLTEEAASVSQLKYKKVDIEEIKQESQKVKKVKM